MGEGIVRPFVQGSARVIFSDLLNEKGKTLEEELGKNVAFYQAAATSPSDTDARMTFAVDRFGSLDCGVNNAGAGSESGPSRELQSRDLIDQMLFCSAVHYWESSMLSLTWKTEPSSISQA